MIGQSATVCSIVVGPDDHGVVRHALAVAAATDVPVVRATEPPATVPWWAGGADVAHLHFTDRLYGPDAPSGASAFERLTEGLSGRRVVTLHDIPEPTGTAHAGRRTAAYLRVARRADALVVCSEHERRRLRQIGIDLDTSVIPLPIAPPAVRIAGRPAPSPAGPGGPGRTVGVLGFIYPGKGHDAVLDAVVPLPDDVVVAALGQVSAGHDGLLRELRETAARTGRRLSVSGFLDDRTMALAMELVDVPVVPASTTSASSSLCSWIAAGRRPLAAANGYTSELAAAAPDLLTLYPPGSPGALRRAIVQALAEPASTWHDGGVPAPLRPTAVAAGHLALYHRLQASR